MSVYYGSGYNPIQNRDCIGNSNSYGPAYNAVIDVVFSDESTTEPVTLQEAKDWCRIDVADDDAIILELISAARAICELHSNISFIQRTVTATLHNGLGKIGLPYGPVTSLPTYTDDEANQLDEYSLKIADEDDAIAVYNAGYNQASIPKNLKNALLNQIAWMYENRGDDEKQSKLSEQSKLILNQVKRTD